MLNLLKVQVIFHVGLLIVTTIYVGMNSGMIVVVWFGFFSVTALIIGLLSMLFSSILLSVKHVSHVSVAKEIGEFQGRVQFAVKKEIDQGVATPPIIMNGSVSTTLQNLLDLIFRDTLEPGLMDFVLHGMDLVTLVKKDAWEALHKLYSKVSKIDPVQFLTQDVVLRVTHHLEKVRVAKMPSLENKEKNNSLTFQLPPFLASEQSELDLLRKMADVMMVNLLPRSYIDCLPLRHFFRELLACQVFQPGINYLCDPDTLNQHLVMHLQLRQMIKKNYAYAASYEEFVSLIEDCEDLNELHQIRCNIVTEIAQATAINSVKRSKGLESDQESTCSSPLGPSSNNANLLQTRNLKRYITQLTYAKLQCERRLRLLGAGVQTGDIPRLTTSTSNFVEDVIPFKTVMRSPRLRHQLKAYLTQQGATQVGLLEFWIAAQELRRLDRKRALTSAAQIFYRYFHGPNPIMKLEKNLIKGMESYLIGDRGPEFFFQAQDMAWKLLEERYYPSFLVVLTCRTTGRQNPIAQNDTDMGANSSKDDTLSLQEFDAQAESDEQEIFVEWNEQTQLTQSRMEQLDSRLAVKLQALSSLRSISPPEKSLTGSLEKEVENLQAERRELENWLNQAQTWAAHMGHWKATVTLPQNSDDKECVRFPVEIHLRDEDGMMATATNATPISRKRVAMSWIVRRQVAEFYALHAKLTQQCSWLKSAQLPALSGKTLFGRPNDRVYLEGSQEKLQSFLDAVMADDVLNKSESLFLFLHNPPACLRPSVNAPKKSSRFFFSTFFKGENTRESDEDVDHENVSTNEETDAMQTVFTDDTRDGIAEPIYHLISEVFELRGVFGWVRRTMVTFVQITYGRTINRQLRDVVTNVFTDQAILSYVQTLVKTWWPGGLLLPSAVERSALEKEHSKNEARNLLANNIPDVLCQLLGQQNARRGVLKVWSALQDERLNKHLFYDLLEVIIKDGFPEISVI